MSVSLLIKILSLHDRRGETKGVKGGWKEKKKHEGRRKE